MGHWRVRDQKDQEGMTVINQTEDVNVRTKVTATEMWEKKTCREK